eukprot:CAMPEP_0172524760 /NCGR_PEP_ID=MMETSP1066-20121228/294358_1 /TAXON_ID=671091 /ORGANISM="Coscinodiscus wailesii, Strain CCMP2513" /LENGTH=271 /DNA_ID=CAMNT_0013307911 /DNA_START=800 /DNA_END=1615 /DNA_ORIENTATION=-
MVVGMALTGLYFSRDNYIVRVIPREPWIVVIIFFWIFHLACAGMVGQLLVFHINLRRENLTTYEYIVRDNAKRRSSEKKKSEKEGRRSAMLRDAKAKGHKMMIAKLMLGKYCSAFDPVKDIPDVEEEIENKPGDIQLQNSIEGNNSISHDTDHFQPNHSSMANFNSNSYEQKEQSGGRRGSKIERLTGSKTYHQDRNEMEHQNGVKDEEEARVTSLEERRASSDSASDDYPLNNDVKLNRIQSLDVVADGGRLIGTVEDSIYGDGENKEAI